MNAKPNPKKLPLIAAVMGLLVLLARVALFRAGKDEKGLLIPGHPLDILVWVLTAAALVPAAIASLSPRGSQKYTDNFGPSGTAALGCFLLACGITATVLPLWSAGTRLEQIRNILGLLAIPALVVLGLHRREGKPPVFLLHGVVCLYLILYAVTHYQLWSSRPQIQNWFFAMAGSLALTLFAYCQTAFDVSLGSRRMQLASGLLTVFFCLAAIAGGEDMALYLGGAAWALTNLCRPAPVPRRRPNPITETIREESK